MYISIMHLFGIVYSCNDFRLEMRYYACSLRVSRGCTAGFPPTSVWLFRFVSFHALWTLVRVTNTLFIISRRGDVDDEKDGHITCGTGGIPYRRGYH